MSDTTKPCEHCAGTGKQSADAPVFAELYYAPSYAATRLLCKWDDEIKPMKVESPPPCSTCSHLEWNPIAAMFDIRLCKRPNRPIDLVTGKRRKTFAKVERQYEIGCGISGRFHSDFKEKP